ncbi:MAG: phage holin family protein [Jatrophihabitantaceae bacterium]
MTVTSQPNSPRSPSTEANGTDYRSGIPLDGLPTGRHALEPSIGQLVSDASTHLSRIVQGEVALAKLELKSSVKNAGLSAGMFITAGVLLFFSLTFGLIALAEGIVAMGIWRWLAYLIVFGFLLLIIGLLVFIGVRKIKRVKAPARTIATSKDTVAYLKANTKRG